MTWDDLPIGYVLLSGGGTFAIKLDKVDKHIAFDRGCVTIMHNGGMHSSGAFSWPYGKTFLPVEFLL